MREEDAAFERGRGGRSEGGKENGLGHLRLPSVSHHQDPRCVPFPESRF